MESSHFLEALRPRPALASLVMTIIGGVLVLLAAVASIALASRQPEHSLAYVVLVAQPLAIILLAMVAWRWRYRHQVVTREFQRRNEAVHQKIQHYASQQDRSEEELNRLRVQMQPMERECACGSFLWHRGQDELEWSPGLYRIAERSLLYMPTVAKATEGLLDDGPERFQRMCEAAWRGETDLACELRYRSPEATQAEVRQWQIRLHPLSDEPHGPVTSLLGTVRDLTASRELAGALANERLLHGHLLDLVADAVLVCDEQLRLVRINQAAGAMLGWSRKRGLGQPLERVLQLLRADDRSDIRITLDTPEPPEPDRMAIVVTPQGQERRVQVRLAQMRDSSGVATGLVLIIRDETARLLIEEQFRRSQKMESVGRLVSGIAHDFNNLLCGMTGYADLLRRKLDADDPRRSYADAILDAAGRAGDLTQRILDTARQRDGGFRQVHIHKLVTDVVGMVRNTISPDIRIETDLQADPDTVLGDISQLQSALLNLVINARDAMADGGELRLHTAVVEAETASGDVRRHRLAVSIADTGHGMSSAVRERIFEPFFTTKEAGRGTGLGLAAVQSIVQEHRGEIRVDSELGVGTTMTLLLPLLAEQQPVSEKQRQQETTRLGRGELILLADDEEILRRMGEDILSNLGYKVLTAANGTEAVELYRQHRSAIKLVLLDVVMPQMNGTTARARIRSLDPNVPIIMCSGCSGEQSFAAYGDRKPSPFLAKPFSAEALGRAVAAQLV